MGHQNFGLFQPSTRSNISGKGKTLIFHLWTVVLGTPNFSQTSQMGCPSSKRADALPFKNAVTIFGSAISKGNRMSCIWNERLCFNRHIFSRVNWVIDKFWISSLRQRGRTEPATAWERACARLMGASRSYNELAMMSHRLSGHPAPLDIAIFHKIDNFFEWPPISTSRISNESSE